MPEPGRLIAFEGGEGAGKSTQLERLAAGLGAIGRRCVATREPGGTPGAEAIRRLLVQGGPHRWTPLSETLLLLAARHDHLEGVIRPALADGIWVLCDRFVDSTRVYQGIAGGLGLELVDRLQQLVIGALKPDLTLILDLPAGVGLARRSAGTGGNRFERMGVPFHERVRAGFLDLARRAPERYVVIDATAPEDQVAVAVRRAVAGRFALTLPNHG
jgi:dTMP kinase